MNKDFNPFNPENFKNFAKFPHFDVDGWLASHRKNMDALSAAQKTTVETLRTIFQMQADYTRQALEGVGAHLKESTKGTPDDKAQRQTDSIKNSLDRAVNHGRKVSSLLTESGRQVFDTLHQRFNEGLEEAQSIAAKSRVKH